MTKTHPKSAQNDQKSTEIPPEISKTHLTSLTYDQNITQNWTKWPKNNSKPKNNAN